MKTTSTASLTSDAHPPNSSKNIIRSLGYSSSILMIQKWNGACFFLAVCNTKWTHTLDVKLTVDKSRFHFPYVLNVSGVFCNAVLLYIFLFLLFLVRWIWHFFAMHRWAKMYSSRHRRRHCQHTPHGQFSLQLCEASMHFFFIFLLVSVPLCMQFVYAFVWLTVGARLLNNVPEHKTPNLPGRTPKDKNSKSY